MTKQPIVTITYQKDDWNKDVPISDLHYREAYGQLYEMAKERGIKMTRASMHWLTEKGFEKGWAYENGTWVKINTFKPDLVWDKSPYRVRLLAKKRKLHAMFPTFNNLKLEQVVSDKFLTHMAFQKYTAKTFLVHNRKEARRVAKDIPSKNVVIKPNVGTGGRSVKIIPKAALATAIIKPFTLIQQYIDASQGIPRLTSGHHDLRVTVMNGRIIYAYIRKPKKGSKIANVARGGTMHIVPLKKIPSQIRAITREVDAFLKPVGDRYYSVDYIYSKRGKPFIVELNAKPGVEIPEDLRPRVYSEIISFFERFLK